MVKWVSGGLARSLSAAALLVGMLASPSLAKDPFRTTNPRAISDRTEQAFRAMFEKGNYTEAQKLLSQADANEPLAFAMKAMITYMNSDGADAGRKQALLNEFKSNADQTRVAAQQLMKTDPLRGNIYMAASTFLNGGYIAATEGTVNGVPKILGSLQEAFRYLDAAERIDPKDPELNLVKGSLDLILAANLSLPLSSPKDAISRLEQSAQPGYVAKHMLAIGYRDLKQFDKALQAIDQAIALAPNNPELSYRKAQILVRQGNYRGSLDLFKKAVDKKAQFPPSIANQIQREYDRAQKRASGS